MLLLRLTGGSRREMVEPADDLFPVVEGGLAARMTAGSRVAP
jgi:hypothetical protein